MNRQPENQMIIKAGCLASTSVMNEGTNELARITFMPYTIMAELMNMKQNK